MRAHECAAEEFSGGLSRVKWSQACVARTHTSLHKAGVKGEEEAAAAGARRNLTSARACWDEERRRESAAAAIHGGYWGALLGRYLALAGGRLYFLFDEPCGQAVGQEETKQAIETLQHPYRVCCVVCMHVARSRRSHICKLGRRMEPVDWDENQCIEHIRTELR